VAEATSLCRDLPTQVEAVNAFREFVEALGAADRIEEKIKPILPQLLRHFFQMANVVEAMDVILCIDTIVERMGEDIQPYAVDCCREVCAHPLDTDTRVQQPVWCLAMLPSPMHAYLQHGKAF
jgi:hypothetical protein